jgi:CRP-like cAMP-binding protein
MINPWTMKMEQFTRFSLKEKQALDSLLTERQKTLRAGEDVIADGAHSPDCHVIISGLACRYKLMPDGTRQIMAFLVPGDLCDAEIFILKVMDHGVLAMTPCLTALISGEIMKTLLRGPGCLGEALWWGTMTDLGVLRERIIDHGRRNARQRISHLLYEMLVRYRMVGLTMDDTFDFPITQVDLADATGLTPVHVNRILKKLATDGIMLFQRGKVSILDPDRLKSVAQFNSSYLHLDRAHDQRAHLDQRTGDLV